MPDRLLDRRGVATKLARSVMWTYRHLAELEAQGFPREVIADRWSDGAIDRWIAVRSGVASPMPAAEEDLTREDIAADLRGRVALLVADH